MFIFYYIVILKSPLYIVRALNAKNTNTVIPSKNLTL